MDISQRYRAGQEIEPETPPGSTLAGRAPHNDANLTTHQPLPDQLFYARLAGVSANHLFAERTAEAGIFDKLFDIEQPKSDIFDIELATLQRMVIHDLQYQLVAVVKKAHSRRDLSKKDMKQARKLLEEYCRLIHTPAT